MPALENQYVSLAWVKREWQREQEDLIEYMRKLSLQRDKERKESHAKMMERCRRVCKRTALEEAEMDNIVNGAPSASDSTSELTREKFVSLFVDPLFDRIEKNDKRLKEAAEWIKEGSPDNEALALAFNNLKSRADNVSLLKTSSMTMFMRKVVQKDAERQTELDNLWDQLQKLGLRHSE